MMPDWRENPKSRYKFQIEIPGWDNAHSGTSDLN
jgi:hypothetical protein